MFLGAMLKLRGVKEYSSTLSILTRQNKIFWGPFLTLKHHTGSFTLPEGPMIVRVAFNQSFFQDYFLRVFSVRDCPWTIIWNDKMLRWRPADPIGPISSIPNVRSGPSPSHWLKNPMPGDGRSYKLGKTPWRPILFLGSRLVTCGGYVAWRSGDPLINVRTICV